MATLRPLVQKPTKRNRNPHRTTPPFPPQSPEIPQSHPPKSHPKRSHQSFRKPRGASTLRSGSPGRAPWAPAARRPRKSGGERGPPRRVRCFYSGKGSFKGYPKRCKECMTCCKAGGTMRNTGAIRGVCSGDTSRNAPNAFGTEWLSLAYHKARRTQKRIPKGIKGVL